MQNNSKMKVLYISGFERSGSTIVNRVLGQIDGFVAWGELRDIWLHGIVENRICSCGHLFTDCLVWQQVFNEAFNGINKFKVLEMIELQKLTRSMVLPHYFGLIKDKSFKKKVGQYLTNLEKLYQAIQVTTNSKVIVDSTKASWYGYILSLLPSIDLYVIHLVRNPKGICYSLEQRKLKGELECQWYNPLHASLSWNLKNYAVEMLLNSSSKRYLRISYENFIQNPQMIVEHILNFLDEKATNLPFIDSSTVKMSTDHIIAGSPSSRSDIGTVKLSLDEKWQQSMRKLDQALISISTFPIAKKYY
ncbi:sulfotransferase [Pleurocapsa sp. PCC 7319]|uniref:sulfotransferase n=1 Tax=Pleurocapsa sp. PCC 7319 TaxID=118161 RepID=UPI00037B09D2|nr:sulfotransferase [Pleurocapsa sp. PCC 7319]